MKARHLAAISRALVEAASGRHKYVILAVPPRHGKSLLTSHWFPVWYLSHWPQHNVILASYALEYSVQWGRRVRNTMQEHKDFLGVELASDAVAAQRWSTKAGGGMFTVGVGGALTGRGANLLLVDDPIKGAEEAASELQRERMWDWWQSTAFTRLEPGGCCVIIMTRWNVDDLVGRILTSETGDQWKEIKFPLLADENDPLGRAYGEPLWPERYGMDEVERIRKSTSAYWFSALYQQTPVLKSGGYFNRDWFEVVERAPSGGRTIRFWDLAGSEQSAKTSDPDYTVGCLVNRSVGGDYYVIDVQRMRASPGEVENKIVEVARRDGPHVEQWFEQEPGSAGKFVVRQMSKSIEERADLDIKVKSFKVTGAKEKYIDQLSSVSEVQRVKLVRGEWNGRFLDELEAYPYANHDDQPDAAAKAYAVLAKKRTWGILKPDRQVAHLPTPDENSESTGIASTT